MFLYSSQDIRVRLIVLLVLVAIHIECRPGGRSRSSRLRKTQHSSSVRKSNTHTLIRGAAAGSAAFLVGSLALRTFVSNSNGHHSRSFLSRGTGDLCVNKENFSNFIFHEFRCPLEPVFTSNERYCCGSNEQQYCCSFWESGGRAVGAIIGIIAACGLFFLAVACCIVYYRRQLKRKAHTYVTAVQADDDDINERTASPQSSIIHRSGEHDLVEAPPPYSEAMRRLNDS